MATQTSAVDAGGPSLRPRIVDVTDTDYATVTDLVDPDTDAYFERKAGHTTLVIR